MTVWHTEDIVLNGQHYNLWHIPKLDYLFGPVPWTDVQEPMPDGDQFEVERDEDGPHGYCTIFLNTTKGMWPKVMTFHDKDGNELFSIKSENNQLSDLGRFSSPGTSNYGVVAFWKAKEFANVRPIYFISMAAFASAYSNKAVVLKWIKD